jgi:hypothetical protein
MLWTPARRTSLWACDAASESQFLQERTQINAVFPRGLRERFESRHRAADARHAAPQQNLTGGGMSIQEFRDRGVDVELFSF